MKRVQSLILMLAVAMMAVATTFTGRVIDETGAPVAFANIVVLNPDSAYIAGATTDDAGVFVVECHHDCAIIKVSYLGYQTQYLPTTGDLGTIQLQPEATLLGEVTVKAAMPVHRLTSEGMVTDVENTLLGRVGTAEEVLQNLPGVQKKDDGIEVFGKGSPLIYINGRQLRDNRELEQLKSEDIKSVEVITNPGARYKADVEAVIIIKTKRAQGEGFSFDTQASYYQSQNTDLALGLNWNYRRGGLDIFGSEWYNEDQSFQGDYIALDVAADTIWHLDNRTDSHGHNRSIYSAIGLNYVFNDNHALGFRYDTRHFFRHQMDGTFTADVIADGAFYDHLVNTTRHRTTSNMPHTLNAYYNGRVGKTTIDLNLDYMFYKDRTSQVNDEVSQELDSRVVTSQSLVRNQLLAGKLVLSWNLWGGNFSAGTEVSDTHRNDDYVNPEQVVPTSFTEQREQGYAFFAEYSRGLPFGNVRVGLRNENVTSDYYNQGVRVDEQSRTYHHLFPNVGLSARFGQVQMMLNYAMKIQRPHYWELRGNVSYGNRFAWESGNPLLRPTILNTVSAMAMYRWMNLMVDYKHSRDPIVNVGQEVPGSEATTLITKDNVDHSDKLRVMMVFSPSFGIYQPQWTLGLIKDWIKIPSPTGYISPSKSIFLLQLNNNLRFTPTLTAMASLQLISKGDMENVSITRMGYLLDVSLTKTFFNDRLSVKVAGKNLLNSLDHVHLRYGLRQLYQESHRDSRELEVTIKYKFNAAQSKYRGTGAGQAERERM